MLTLALFCGIVAAAEPLDTLRGAGCLACHPAGGAGVGPALTGRVGTEQRVLRDGVEVTVTVDEAYVRRALQTPDAERLLDQPAGLMPAVTDPGKVGALVAAVMALTPQPAASPLWLLGVLLGGLGFAGGHLVLSGERLRARLVARFGEQAFMGIYSLPIGLSFALLIGSWSMAPYVGLWTPAPWTRWLAVLGMPWVMIAQVAGYTTPTPTMAGMAERVHEGPRGIHRITRHPVNITSAIWALLHVPANGDVASLGLFLTILVLGVAGSLHIDRKRARAYPEAWARYAAQTSVWPFVAILQGRQTLSLRELGLWRIALGLGLYAGILFWAHAWLIGASPLP